MSFHPRRIVSRSCAAQNVQAADRQLGRRNRRLQQTDQPLPKRLDAGAIEQVGGVFHHPRDPGRRAVRGALLAQIEREVELGGGGLHRLNRGGEPRQLESWPAALFWNASITWNSGCRANERAGLSTSTSRSNGRSWWL